MDDFLRPHRPKLRLNQEGQVNLRHDVPHLKSDTEPTFRPPEEIAADESKLHNENPENKMPKSTRKKRGIWHKRWHTSSPKGWKQWSVFGSLGLLIISGIVAGWWFTIKPDTNLIDRSKPLEKVAYVPPPPPTVASKLSGLQVDAAVNLRPVTAVMIENSQEARP